MYCIILSYTTTDSILFSHQLFSISSRSLICRLLFAPHLGLFLVEKEQGQTVNPLKIRGFPICPYYAIRAHLCQFASEQWHPHETDPDMVRPQHFLNHRRHLCPSGFLCPGAVRSGNERDVPTQRGIHSVKKAAAKTRRSPDWRSGWDSNPRTGSSPIKRFRVVRVIVTIKDFKRF